MNKVFLWKSNSVDKELGKKTNKRLSNIELDLFFKWAFIQLVHASFLVGHIDVAAPFVIFVTLSKL